MTHPLLIPCAALALAPLLAPAAATAQRRSADTVAAAAAPADSASRGAPRLPYWVNFGVAGTAEELGLGVSFTRARDADQIVTVRALVTEEFCLLGCGSRPDHTVEVGALYGIAMQSRFAVLSVAAGGAVLALRRTVPVASSTTYATREVGGLTVGIPVEGQLFLRPFRFLGVGLAGVANLNPKHSFAGALVGFQVGRLTTR
jgi:hypothetical protein